MGVNITHLGGNYRTLVSMLLAMTTGETKALNHRSRSSPGDAWTRTYVLLSKLPLFQFSASSRSEMKHVFTNRPLSTKT